MRKFEVGDSVFFRCLNPATGTIKRISHKHNWADVRWFNGYSNYTRRVSLNDLVHLVPVLNQYLEKKNV